MDIPFIQFRAGQKSSAAKTLSINSVADLKNLTISEPPQALLISEKYLDHLHTFKELILDRRQKDARKGLAFYLIGKNKNRIPLIRGDFASSGKLMNSIGTLLKKAVAVKDCRTFIIAIKDDKFIEMRDRYFAHFEAAATSSEPNVQPVENRVEPQVVFESSKRPPDSVHVQDVADQIDFDVPESLNHRYLGHSPATAMVRKMIMAAARAYATSKDPTPVLIVGPSGTGKELVARAIHTYSGCKGPFVTVNCGAIAKELIESELFGHKKGAFTGAVSDKTGNWESADGGTLFLDEIGDLLPEHQVKILRALENKEIRRVGDNDVKHVHARIVAATNRDLFFMVRNNQFREDLFYRLRGIKITTPALSDCPANIPLIANHFWEKITGSVDAQLPESVQQGLTSYPWPGNVRHLKSVLRQLYDLFPNKDLDERHLHYIMALDEPTLSIGPARPGGKGSEHNANLAKCLRHLRRVDEAVHATMAMISPYLSAKELSQEKQNYVKTEVQHHLNEMEWLFQDPLLFGSHETYASVYRLKGKLTFFDRLLAVGYVQAREYWDREVKDEFEHVLATIFTEFGNVQDQA